MDEHLRWQRWMLMEKTATALNRHGFRSVLFAGRDEALPFLLNEALSAETIGFGGSMTLAELGLARQVGALGKRMLIHSRAGLSAGERRAVMQEQLNCDLFFTSSNAVTLDGNLVNIDATGNRVCAMTFGPPRVWVVVGSNKIAADLPTAIRRIKEVAAPPNARRLGYQTPCAVTGLCSDCDSPERICRVTTIIERQPRATAIGICLINENLGY